MGEGGNQFSNLKLKRSNEYSHVNEKHWVVFRISRNNSQDKSR